MIVNSLGFIVRSLDSLPSVIMKEEKGNMILLPDWLAFLVKSKHLVTYQNNKAYLGLHWVKEIGNHEFPGHS